MRAPLVLCVAALLAGCPAEAPVAPPQPDAGEQNPADADDLEPTDAGDLEPADAGEQNPADAGDLEPADAGDLEPADAGDPSATDAGSPADAGATASCGNGVLEQSELCDGDCPAACDDGDGCTVDSLLGEAAECTARCEHASISACVGGDGCCAPGCDRSADGDCPYYVDATGGDDAFDGLTPQKAWRTLAKLNAMTLSPGTRVALKRGEVWREPLVIKSAGTASLPIVFSAYGSGSDRPVISPSAQVTSWTQAAGSMFVADFQGDARQLFVDGARLPIARHPNQGFLYADSDEAASSTSFLDSDLQASREELVGATILIRSVRWAFDVRTVVDFAAQRLGLDLAVRSWGSINVNDGYILANKLWMLDSPGEWFHDTAAGKLYVRLPGEANPEDHLVEVSTSDYGIEAKVSRGLVLDGLEVRQAGRDGIRLVTPSDTRVQRCLVQGSGHTGIMVVWPPADAALELVDNVVADSASNGLWVSADPAQPTRIVVARNQILDTMVQFPAVDRAAMASAETFGYGALIQGNATRFEENTVRAAGYDCSSFTGRAHRIERNFVERCLSVVDDGAGIYLNGDSHLVRSNLVVDMIGNAEGTPAYFTDPRTEAQGIYSDDRTHDIRMEENTVVNADFGFQVHNAYDDRLVGNRVFGCRRAGLFISEDTVVNQPGFVHGNVFEENTIVCDPGAYAVQEGGFLGSVAFGTFDRNRYWHADGAQPIRRTVKTGTQYLTREFSLQSWREATGNDLQSSDLAAHYSVVPRAARPTGAELIQNGTFDTDATGWSSYPTGTLTWASDCGLTGGCSLARNAAATSGAYLSSAALSLTEGRGYELRMSAKASAADSLKPVMRRSSSPWDAVVASLPTAWIDTSRGDLRFGFVAPATATVRFELRLPETATQFSLDGVSLREAALFENDPADDVQLFYNPTLLPQRVELQGRELCGLDGAIAGAEIELAPLSAELLVSCFCNRDFECNNRETALGCAQDCQ